MHHKYLYIRRNQFCRTGNIDDLLEAAALNSGDSAQLFEFANQRARVGEGVYLQPSPIDYEGAGWEGAY